MTNKSNEEHSLIFAQKWLKKYVSVQNLFINYAYFSSKQNLQILLITGILVHKR